MLSKRLTYTVSQSRITYSKVTDRKPIFAKNKLKVELYEMKQSRRLDHTEVCVPLHLELEDV